MEIGRDWMRSEGRQRDRASEPFTASGSATACPQTQTHTGGAGGGGAGAGGAIGGGGREGAASAAAGDLQTPEELRSLVLRLKKALKRERDGAAALAQERGELVTFLWRAAAAQRGGCRVGLLIRGLAIGALAGRFCGHGRGHGRGRGRGRGECGLCRRKPAPRVPCR